MLFAITATPQSGDPTSLGTAAITTPAYQVSGVDLTTIMAAIGANPQALGVSPKNAVSLGTPQGVINAIAQKIVNDIERLANSYQNQQAAQAAIKGVTPVSIVPAAASS